MGSKGEVRINQAERGYKFTGDDQGQVVWLNPYVCLYTFVSRTNRICFP